MEIKCITKLTTNIKFNGLGLIGIPLGFELRKNLATLPGLEPFSGTSLIVYTPNTHSDLTKLSTHFHDNSSVRLPLPTSLPTAQDPRYRKGDKALDQLEQQLHDFSLQRQEKASYSNLIHGSTCWTCCHRKKSPTSGEPDSDTTLTISG